MDGPHFAACHSPLPCAIASCNWDLWVSTVLYGGHATASYIPVFVCARVNKVNSIRGTEECVCERKERGGVKEWMMEEKRGGTSRRGRKWYTCSKRLLPTIDLYFELVCVCVYALHGVIDLSSMISSPCFLSSFSFFFYNRYPYFTLDCYRLIGGNELKRIINLVKICYRSTWIKLIRDVINR